MRLFIILISLIFTLLLTAGCTPTTTYGVPNEQWNKMSKEQQNLAIKGYYSAEKARQAEEAKLAKQRQIEEARQERIDQEHQQEIDRINAKNRPINDAISIISDAVSNNDHHHHHHHHSDIHKSCITGSFNETACGYNCYKDDFGHPHCANDPDKKCITGSFNKTECGYNCYKDDFGNPHCADS